MVKGSIWLPYSRRTEETPDRSISGRVEKERKSHGLGWSVLLSRDTFLNSVIFWCHRTRKCPRFDANHMSFWVSVIILQAFLADPGALVPPEEALPHIATVPSPTQRLVEPPASTRAVEQRNFCCGMWQIASPS